MYRVWDILTSPLAFVAVAVVLFLQILDNAGKEFAKMRHYFTGTGIGFGIGNDIGIAQGYWYLVGNGLFHM